jgi:hypothetical protein
MLDSMVRWYPRKTPFVPWDRCSKRMGTIVFKAIRRGVAIHPLLTF